MLLFARTRRILPAPWIQQSKEHVTGPEYGNAVQTQMTVLQNKDSVVINSLNPGADGKDVAGHVSFAINGKPSSISNPTSKRKYTRSLAWSADKKSLITTIVFSMPDNENEVDFTRIETWTLSPDGKQLRLNKKSVETRSETWELNAVFVKQ